MPPALIAAIATVAAAATTTGVSLYEASNQPGTPKPPTAAPMTPGQNAQTTAAVGQQLPNLQSLTGGSVSPEYAAQYGSTQAGVGNDPKASGDVQAAINNFFGLTAPGSTGLTGGGGGGGSPILDMLTKGGKPSTPGTGGGTPDFVNSLLSSDSFKGLAG